MLPIIRRNTGLPSVLVLGGALLVSAIGLATAQETSDFPGISKRIESRISAKLARLEGAALHSQPALLAPPSGGRNDRRPPAIQTFTVDCDRGRTISRALSRARGDTVVIEISGTCNESVEIRRANVTLRGVTDAVIDPPDDDDGKPVVPAILAVGAHDLVVENLTLRGATEGLLAVASRRVVVDRVTATGNRAGTFFSEGLGLVADGSEVEVTNSDFSGNDAPVVANRGSQLRISDSTMENNTLDGPFSFVFSRLTMVRVVVRNNGLGPQAVDHSRTRLFDCTVDASPIGFAFNNSSIHIQDSTITRSEVEFVSRNSNLYLLNSSMETANLSLFQSSSLEIRGSSFEVIDGGPGLGGFSDTFVKLRPDSTITGNVTLAGLSRGELLGTITGAVICDGFSDVMTDPANPPTGGVSGCN